MDDKLVTIDIEYMNAYSGNTLKNINTVMKNMNFEKISNYVSELLRHTGDDNTQFLISSIIAIFAIVAFVILFQKWYKNNCFFRINERQYKHLAVLVIIAGWIIYFIGFLWEGTLFSPLAFLFRPLLSSLEMFVSHSDLLEVNPELKKNAVYMTFFALIHFAAVVLSAIFVLHYLGARLSSIIRFHHVCKVGFNDLYVFFGVDENSMLLAKDILKKDIENKDVIVFVELPVEDEVNDSRISLERLFAHFSYRRELLDMVNACGAILKRSSYLKANPISFVDDRNDDASKDDLLKYLSIDRLMEKANGINFMILSDDEKANVNTSLDLLRYPTILECTKNIKIFCHARRSNINTTLENLSTVGENRNVKVEYKQNLKISMIDTSFLSVQSLKMHKGITNDLHTEFRLTDYFDCYPVNFINCHEGLATSDFTAMVIGFGETGQDALKFVYEFGQFPYADESVEHFHCYAVDRNMDCLMTDFLVNVPGMASSTSGIEYLSMDVHSNVFWIKVNQIIENLNYVIIALDDDDENMELAVRLNEFALRKKIFDERTGRLCKFGIFVKSKNRDNDVRMNIIGGLPHSNITVFGGMTDIFKKEIIIDDNNEVLGAEFYKMYSITNKEFMICDKEDTPDDVHRKRMTKERSKASNAYNINICNRMAEISLKRKEGQDKSNAYHIYTKLKLIDSVFDDNELTRDIHEVVERAKRLTVGEMDDFLKECMKKPYFLNLSRCEHKRWNASHYALGYTLMSSSMYKSDDNVYGTCDLFHKQHACLVSWDELPAVGDYQKYDAAVVLTSFAIALSRENNGKI